MTLNLFVRNIPRIQTLIPAIQIKPVRHASLPTRNSPDLKDRVAVVTAGTNGIGLAIAKRLAENGAYVVISSRNQENVEKAVEKLRSDGLQVSGFACHVGKEEERKELISKVLEQHGDINIFVQNAGVNPQPVGIMKTPESVIDKTCDLHIKSNFRFIQQLYPHMKKSDKPCSIILTSTATAYLSHLYPGMYAITKSAVNTMTRSFMPALIQHNIRINCIAIGGILTDFMEPVLENHETKTTFLANIPMKRMGKSEEIAGVAAYLASDDSSYVTGETFTVAGGAYCRP